MLRENHVRSWLTASVSALAGAAALSVYLQWDWNITYWPLAMLLVLSVYFGHLWFVNPKRKERRIGLAFGMLFVFLQICGRRLAVAETLAVKTSDFLWLAAAAMGLSPAAGGMFAALTGLIAKRRALTPISERRKSMLVLIGCTALFLLCWLPYLLAFYPGLFTYDISWQYEQYQTWKLNTHHPLLHTLLVGWFCDLGWHLFGYPAKGILMYTVFQMTLMALAMASAVRLLYRHRAPLWCCAAVTALNALMPFHALLVISSTKDTLFSGAVLYLVITLLELFLEKDALHRLGWIVRFLIALVLVGLLRNNGFVCMAAVLAAALVCIVRWKKAAVKLAALTMAGIVLYSSANTLLISATDAEKGHFREMLSVPLQQMARVYALTDDPAKAEIKEWLPTVELYSPHLADLVKNTFEAEKEQLPQVFSLWLEVGLRHPVVYLDSLLVTSAGFYDISAEPTGDYLETRFHTDEGKWIVDGSKWPELRAKTANLYSNNAFLDIPLYNLLLSPALWVWIMLFAAAAGWCVENRAVVFAAMAPIALYLTTLLSPCVMTRYLYPFMLCAPVLASVLFIGQKTEENQ